MATHCSILAWRIPWTEEPGRLQSMGSQRVRHRIRTQQQQIIITESKRGLKHTLFPMEFGNHTRTDLKKLLSSTCNMCKWRARGRTRVWQDTRGQAGTPEGVLSKNHHGGHPSSLPQCPVTGAQ